MAAAGAAMRGAEVLAKRLPAVPQKLATLQPELSKDAPDPAAMDQWLRFAEIVDSPMRAVDFMADGTFSAEEAEVLREAHPGFYQQMRDVAAVEIQRRTARGEVIPYDKALALGTLLDVVADPTLDPAFIAAMQRPASPPTPPLAPSRRAVSRAPQLYDPSQEI